MLGALLTHLPATVRMKPHFTLSDFLLIPANFGGFLTPLTRSFTQLPSAVKDIYPCSPMQRKMFLSQSKSSGCYEAWTEFKATSLYRHKEINMGRLQRAWQSVVDSNPILRTCIFCVDDLVLQVVLENYKTEMIIVQKKKKRMYLQAFLALCLWLSRRCGPGFEFTCVKSWMDPSYADWTSTMPS